MSILSRFSDIVSANINVLLDKCENPEKMVDQYLRNAMDDLAEVKKETASVIAEETRTKRALDNANAEITKYEELAKKAISAGNDDDAKLFISKKQELEAGLISLKSAYDTAHKNSDNMRQMFNKLTEDIATLQSRRNNVKAQMSVAKTQDTINRISDKSSKIEGALGAFARMEEKAQRALDETTAEKELNNDPGKELKSAEDRYSGVNSQSVDDELARLKSELGV